jgi:hypothetical protein
MHTRRARVLVVDGPERSLSCALETVLLGHEVHVANDVFDAVYRVEGAGRPYDIILCDLARVSLAGPELWAYLSIAHKHAAERMVFVASGPLQPQAWAFLSRSPNPCIDLPASSAMLEAVVSRRAAGIVWDGEPALRSGTLPVEPDAVALLRGA